MCRKNKRERERERDRERERERLTTVVEVQSSGQVTSLQLPSLIMGSMVKVWPGFITPIALFSETIQRVATSSHMTHTISIPPG